MNDANKKFYFTQIRLDEALSFLDRSVKDHLIASVWQKGQDKAEIEEFEIIKFHPDEMKLVLQFKGGLLSKITGSKNKEKSVLVKISFGNLYIFTNSVLNVSKEKEVYSVIIDKDIFKSQQRSNYRLSATRYVKIQFKIANEVFDALDISAGGTSFLIPAHQKEVFEQESLHDGCILRLVNVNYVIPTSKIAALWPHEYKDKSGNIVEGYKVGISFIDLPKKIEEELFLAINTEARGEEIRKKTEEKKLNKAK